MDQTIPKGLIINCTDLDFKLNQFLGDQCKEINLHELTSSNAPGVVAIIPYGANKDTISYDELFERLPNLRVIAVPGTGYEHVNLELARSRGILVGNAPQAFKVETAEFAFTLLLAVTRKLIPAISYKKVMQENSGHNLYQKFLSVPIAGSKLGIVGMGNVGFEIAKRARGFDMSVLYHNRKQRADESEVGAEYVPSLKQMLPFCDFLVLAVRATGETHHLIGKDELALVKSTCVIINIARGSVIDHEALVAALREGRVGGTGLDVTEPSFLPPDHSLLNMENVIVTPHIAWAGEKGFHKLCQALADNIRAGTEGKPLPYPVEYP